jgi:hypothetical protein
MSTNYAPSKKVRAGDLFDGRLEKYGVREQVTDAATETSRCLTDGRNCLWVSINDVGLVSQFSRYGANAAGKILNAVADTFDTEIASEHEPHYWGFDTQEEWDAAWDQMVKEDEERFYTVILKYLQGQPNDIKRGTVGMCKAEIAKNLFQKDTALLLPENKEKLLNGIKSVYDREHTVTVTLTAQEVAAAKMAVTHEGDLPRA